MPFGPGRRRAASTRNYRGVRVSSALLNEADLQFIASRGVPYPPREDLTLLDSTGRVVFTVKGAQFYRSALGHYGLSRPLSVLCTEDDLYDLSEDILQVKCELASRVLCVALEAGEIPAAERETVTARLFGTIAAWFSAVVFGRSYY